jgi:lambda family phage portal protein
MLAVVPGPLDHVIKPSTPTRSAGSDAARTTTENKKHWNRADSRGPVSETTPTDRRTLRARSRYECRNNPYYRGAVRTIVGDTVGTGPRLQMLTPDLKLNAEVEALWRIWASASDWALNCRVLVGVGEVVGECFGVFRDSKKLARLGLPITLALKLIEPDQVAHPNGRFLAFGQFGDDGIETDEDGEPLKYSILKAHPGDPLFARFATQNTLLDADLVLHWFEPSRPGQLRGDIPWEAAIPILNDLRRFSKAVVTAAEVAAMLAGVMKNPNLPPQAEDYLGQQAKQENWFDTVELVRGMLVTLPPGMDVEQFKPEHPTTTYQQFVEAKLREIGRCRNMPFGKIAGDHSRYNYSSARMDDAPYWHDRDIQRQALEAKVFDPFLYRWFEFAKFVVPALLKYDGGWWQISHAWQYDARPTSDPTADATADELNLTNAADTLTAICTRDGTTLTAVLDTRKAERDEFVKRGLPLPPWLAGGTAPTRNEKGRPTAQQPGGAVTGDATKPGEPPVEGEAVANDKAGEQAAAAGDVQGTALNGAQIVALDAICAKLTTDEYPAGAAESLIKAAYPLMDKALVHDFVTGFSAHDAPSEPEPAVKKESANAA